MERPRPPRETISTLLWMQAEAASIAASRRCVAVHRAEARRPCHPRRDEQPGEPRRHGACHRRPPAAAMARGARQLAARRVDHEHQTRRPAPPPRRRRRRPGSTATDRAPTSVSSRQPLGGGGERRPQCRRREQRSSLPVDGFTRPTLAARRVRAACRSRICTAQSSWPSPISGWACSATSGRRTGTTRAASGVATVWCSRAVRPWARRSLSTCESAAAADTVGNTGPCPHFLRPATCFGREISPTVSYAEPLTVADMARAAHLSPAHFSREFRRTFGESPHQYLLTRRLERAAALLRTTDWVGRPHLPRRRNAEPGDVHDELPHALRRDTDRVPGKFAPAAAPAVVPMCVTRVYGRPRYRTIREDTGGADQ